MFSVLKKSTYELKREMYHIQNDFYMHTFTKHFIMSHIVITFNCSFSHSTDI